MDKSQFKGGFTVRDDDEPMFSIEWVFDERETDPNKLQFLAYDANLWPMSDFETWTDEDFKKKNIEIALKVTHDFTGAVWLDNTKIK